jgi:hypothetical protein
MANKRSPKKRRPAPKTVLRLPDLDQAKSAVLNSLSSRDAQRGYRHAMDEFIEWCCSPKPSIIAARRFTNSQKGPYRAFWLHFRRRWSEFAILENFRIFAVALTPTGC